MGNNTTRRTTNPGALLFFCQEMGGGGISCPGTWKKKHSSLILSIGGGKGVVLDRSNLRIFHLTLRLQNF